MSQRVSGSRRGRRPAPGWSTAGFTLIEMMIVMAIIALLATISIPSLVLYIQKSRTVEAIEALDKISASAQAYFQVTQNLPHSSSGYYPPTTHPQACTATAGIFPSSGPTFQVEPWETLKFQMSEDHRYRYAWFADLVAQEGYANAMGDLDCDGLYGIWQTRLFPDGQGGLRRIPAIIVLGTDFE